MKRYLPEPTPIPWSRMSAAERRERRRRRPGTVVMTCSPPRGIGQMLADAQAALGRAHTAALTGPLDPPSQ